MGKPKIARKKLLKEPDEFLSFSSRVLQQARAHRFQVLCSVAVLFGILAIFSGIRFISNKNENQASFLLEKALEQYARSLPAQGPADALKAVDEDFAQILDRYSGTSAGKRARIYYGNICYAAGDADKAIELYQKALADWKKEPSIRNLVLASLAYAYEKKNDLQTAAQTLEKIQDGSDRVEKDVAIFNLGRLYAKLGEEQKSLTAFEAVAADYPDSIYAPVAKEKAGTGQN